MCSAAEFFGKFSHTDNAHGFAILLAKESLCAGLLRFFNRKHLCYNRDALRNLRIYNRLCFLNFFLCHRRKMREIKTQVIRVY